MGVNEKQTELWVEPVNLARRVPEDHILRKLNRALDLGFVRQEVTPVTKWAYVIPPVR
jgi:hypothetical protein